MVSFDFNKFAALECSFELFLELVGNVFGYFLLYLIQVLINVLAVFVNQLIPSNFPTTGRTFLKL